MSQTILAKAVKVTYQQIQSYENGTSRVSVGRLQQIAKCLKLPVTFFFDDLSVVGSGSEISAMLNSPYSIRLLRAFVKIHDRKIQLSTAVLVETIADAIVRQPAKSGSVKRR